jgi:hypothetical protein
MSSVTLTNSKVLVTCDIDVPAGFAPVDRLNPRLEYPFELGGVLNVPLAPGEATDESGFPRIDLLPPRGVLLWIVAYDTTYEADAARQPVGGSQSVTGVPSLRSRKETPSRWDNVLWSQTEIRLGATKTCQIFTFVGGSPFAPSVAIDGLSANITFTG